MKNQVSSASVASQNRRHYKSVSYLRNRAYRKGTYIRSPGRGSRDRRALPAARTTPNRSTSSRRRAIVESSAAYWWRSWWQWRYPSAVTAPFHTCKPRRFQQESNIHQKHLKKAKHKNQRGTRIHCSQLCRDPVQRKEIRTSWSFATTTVAAVTFGPRKKK